MRVPDHFYSRFGIALTMVENDISNSEDLTMKHFSFSIQKGLNQFRLKPQGPLDLGDYVTMEKVDELDGNPKNAIYLSPWIITSDKSAKGLYKNGLELMELKEENWEQIKKLKFAYAPLAGEYNNGKARHVAPAKFYEHLAIIVTTLSSMKPAMTAIDYSGNRPSYTNTTIIPDLPLNEMIDFLKLFGRIQRHETKDLFQAKVKIEKNGKRSLTRERIRVFRGNFPNAPFHFSMHALSLLGSLGHWANRAENSAKYLKVLESLKGKPIYLVSIGSGEVTSFHHFAIDLAKQDSLSKIINSSIGINLFSEKQQSEKFNRKNTNYNKLFLFFGRFLHLFSKPTFRDFFAIRAEYPPALEPLFITYFTKVEQMELSIIEAAKAYGRQLNWAAFLAAKNEQDSKTTIWERKAKALVELESAVGSARSIDALFAHLSIRAARLLKSDFQLPPTTEPFITAALNQQISLDEAKNLLIIFLRLRHTKEREGDTSDEPSSGDLELEASLPGDDEL